MSFASMKRLPRHWSLSTLLLVFTILALTASHLRVSWLLSETQRQVAWLESRREMTSWPEPDAVNVLLLDPESKSLNLESQELHWTWRLQLPPGKLYRLHAESSASLPPFDTSGTQKPPNISEPILVRGRSVLSVTVRKSPKGRLNISCGSRSSTTQPSRGPNLTYGFGVPDGCDLFELAGSHAKYAGLNGITTAAPDDALELACVRSTDTDAGFRIWIEPVQIGPADENQ